MQRRHRDNHRTILCVDSGGSFRRSKRPRRRNLTVNAVEGSSMNGRLAQGELSPAISPGLEAASINQESRGINRNVNRSAGSLCACLGRISD